MLKKGKKFVKLQRRKAMQSSLPLTAPSQLELTLGTFTMLSLLHRQNQG